MNWFRHNILQEHDLKISFVPLQTKQVMVKLAYMSKDHSTGFNDTMSSDGYTCKVSLTESKSRIVLTAVFMNDVHSFPLYSENWKYPKEEIKRALKTYNRCVNVVEDLKAEYEDDDMPGPTLQGMAREALRYLDIDRKDVAPSRSLEAAKYLDGETDWRSSIYGNRMPHQYGHPLTPPTINITNTGPGSININSPVGSVGGK
jgi:hypothetical protein